MKYVQVWCKGKPIFLRIMTKLLIFSPTELHWGLELNRKGDWPEGFQVPEDHRAWLRLYRRSRRILQTVYASTFANERKVGFRIAMFYTAMRELTKIPKDVLLSACQTITPQEFQFMQARSLYLWTDTEKRVDRMVAELLDDSKPTPPALLEAIRSPEFQFFLRVWFPCYHAHGMAPSKLLRRARRGDIAACEKLIQLDKTAQFDPGVARIMHQHAHAKPSDVHRILVEASLKAPYREIELTTQKGRIGALLIKIARMLKYPLNASHIRKLYNAAARDLHPRGRILTDHSITLLGAGFRKSIQRGHAFWLPIVPQPPQA